MARHKLVNENDPFILLFYPFSQVSCCFEEVIFLGHDNIRMEQKKIGGGGNVKVMHLSIPLYTDHCDDLPIHVAKVGCSFQNQSIYFYSFYS